MQRLGRDHARQAVGAEQVAVAGEGGAARHVGAHVAGALQRPHQHRAARVLGRLLGGHPAVVDERLHQRVVVGDLVEDSVAQHVAARVAHVGQGEAAAVPQHGGQRRAHAVERRVGVGHALEGLGRLLDGALQGGHRVALQRRLRQHADRGRAGHLAVVVAAHAVGDDEQAGLA